jgi:hypothetical protein
VLGSRESSRGLSLVGGQECGQNTFDMLSGGSEKLKVTVSTNTIAAGVLIQEQEGLFSFAGQQVAERVLAA